MLFNKCDDIRIVQKFFICFRKYTQIIRETLNHDLKRNQNLLQVCQIWIQIFLLTNGSDCKKNSNERRR